VIQSVSFRWAETPTANGLLADIKVEKTGELALAIKDAGRGLELPDQDHLLVEPEQFRKGDVVPRRSGGPGG